MVDDERYIKKNRPENGGDDMAKVKVDAWQCERCGHVWMPRGDPRTVPRVCPKCKSPYWNTPRKKR